MSYAEDPLFIVYQAISQLKQPTGEIQPLFKVEPRSKLNGIRWQDQDTIPSVCSRLQKCGFEAYLAGELAQRVAIGKNGYRKVDILAIGSEEHIKSLRQRIAEGTIEFTFRNGERFTIEEGKAHPYAGIATEGYKLTPCRPLLPNGTRVPGGPSIIGLSLLSREEFYELAAQPAEIASAPKARAHRVGA